MMADEDGNLSFRVGRNYLSEFYYQILPELRDVADQVISGDTGQLAGMTRDDLLELLE